jgi:CcmD family protein
MNAQSYLLIANAAVWVGIGAYLLFLGQQSSRLKKRLEQLHLMDGPHDEHL